MPEMHPAPVKNYFLITRIIQITQIIQITLITLITLTILITPIILITLIILNYLENMIFSLLNIRVSPHTAMPV